MSGPPEVTRLLSEWRSGDTSALHRLLPIVYDDLQAIAHNQLARERANHTLDTKALVHESYVNLVEGADVGWRDRGHFFAVASRAMRHVLIDYARRRNAEKRGGGRVAVTLDERLDLEYDERRWEDLLALDEALEALERHDERLARVVECRYFAGLTAAETAEALAMSQRTVERNWTRARAHLKRTLEGEPRPDE